MLLKEEKQDMKNKSEERQGSMMESPMGYDGKPGEAMESP